MNRWAAALLALALWALSALPARADGPNAIAGRVVNRTPGGGSVAGLEVALMAFGATGAPQEGRTARTDAQGAFRFEGLSDAAAYAVAVRYGGAEYAQQDIRLGPGETTKEVDISVYEPTEDGQSLRAELAHTVIEIDPESRALLMLEYTVLANSGDKTYVGTALQEKGTAPAPGEKRQTLRFSLPAGATQFRVNEGLPAEALVERAGGFADTRPFPPGKREVIYSYALSYQAASYAFSRLLDYPTDRLNFLVADFGGEVQSGQLTPPRAAEMAGRRYWQLTGQGLSAGTALEVAFAGLPQPQGGARSPAGNFQLVGLGLLAAVLALALAYPWLRRRGALAPAAGPSAPEGEKEALVGALAELDERHEAGEIAEEEYQKQRRALKERLRERW